MGDQFWFRICHEAWQFDDWVSKRFSLFVCLFPRRCEKQSRARIVIVNNNLKNKGSSHSVFVMSGDFFV